MDWWNALDPGVQRGIGIAALALAVVIIMLIVQLIASWRSNKSALKLFERQAVEQRNNWQAWSEEQQRRRLLAERQEAYARFMSLASEYERMVTDLRAPRPDARNVAAPGDSRHARNDHAQADLDATDPMAVTTALATSAANEVTARQAQLREDLSQAREVVRLLAPSDVRFAADRWFIDLVRDDPAGVQRAKNDFLTHARADIGSDRPAPPPGRDNAKRR
ncbi:hypothetical protein ABN034_12110 [Actinopolymorpha sp. B11F2]|uniref:hypothetical protein n=1 Tax=Actinopolymorpha sp. B11F2 TaxID=3160862 RepID=UPI0032E48E14